MPEADQYQQLLEKYKAKISEEFGEHAPGSEKITSKEYTEFKQEIYPARYTWYEKACNTSEGILKLKVTGDKAVVVQKDIDLCHLNVTPSGVTSFAVIAVLIIAVVGSLLGFAFPMLFGGEPKVFLVFFFLFVGAVSFPALQKIPSFMANTWRMKTSNQMVQSIFYLVTYMRHTSNLERAIGFAADHLDPPLSLDFRKILWDVETQKYSTIRESAESYLNIWKEWEKDFVESFHLVESSLFEGSEERRLALLDKALDVILNGTYENMLHYAHNLKSPMTMLHMLGIVLPILGLVILPLVVSFMSSDAGPFGMVIYIVLLYDVTLPIAVYYLGKNILAKRPAGYGAMDIGELQGMEKYKKVNISLGKSLSFGIHPLFFSLFVLVVCLAMGISPLLLHNLGSSDVSFDKQGNLKLLDYICPPSIAGCSENEKIGPYGIGAALLSLVLIAGLGVSAGLYFSLRSKNVLAIRERTKALEDEFSSALFQLGNRLGDGLPAEIAFARVAETMKGTTSGDFFNVAEKNITKLGMGLEQALFDPKVGALASFPSKIIESSMKVLNESIKKGPRIAAQALLSMSRYIKEIHRVEERLRDLMADVIASMKSQVKFLTPAIAGIVIGITSMISAILAKLSAQLTCFAQQGAAQEAGNIGDTLGIFGLGIPTFHFQIIIGIYLVQITYILTVLISGIENGADKLGERFELGKNLTHSTIAYCVLAGIVMLLFNIFATSIMSNTLKACGG